MLNFGYNRHRYLAHSPEKGQNNGWFVAIAAALMSAFFAFLAVRVVTLALFAAIPRGSAVIALVLVAIAPIFAWIHSRIEKTACKPTEIRRGGSGIASVSQR
jgi:hypothetical protein